MLETRVQCEWVSMFKIKRVSSEKSHTTSETIKRFILRLRFSCFFSIRLQLIILRILSHNEPLTWDSVGMILCFRERERKKQQHRLYFRTIADEMKMRWPDIKAKMGWWLCAIFAISYTKHLYEWERQQQWAFVVVVVVVVAWVNIACTLNCVTSCLFLHLHKAHKNEI